MVNKEIPIISLSLAVIIIVTVFHALKLYPTYSSQKGMNQSGGGFFGDLFSKTEPTIAKISINNDQLFVNKSAFEQLSKQANKVMAETIVENAMSSGAYITNVQSNEMDDIVITGDGNKVKSSQTSEAKISFDGMNTTQAANEAATKFVQQAMTDMSSLTTNDALIKMEGNAEAKATAGALATGSAAANTDINIRNSIQSITENSKSIQKILENEVSNTFKTSTITDCVSSIQSSQSMKAKKLIINGNNNVYETSQSSLIDMLSKCKALTNTTNKILNDTFDTLGVKIVEDTAVKTETDIKAKAKAESENTGPIQDFFNGMAKLAEGWITIIILAIVGFVVFIVILIVIMKMM